MRRHDAFLLFDNQERRENVMFENWHPAFVTFINPVNWISGIMVVAPTCVVLYFIFGRDKKSHLSKGGD